MSESKSKRTVAERVTLGISLAILVIILGVSAWTSDRLGDAAPQIEIEIGFEEIRTHGENYYVPITITNTGGLTAQDLVVTGELDTGSGEPETADVTLTFLGGNESETAEIVFSEEPTESNLTVRPTSFSNP